MADEFDFEELIADMLNISDDLRDSEEGIVCLKFYEKFGIDFDKGYELAEALLPHTPQVEAGLSGKAFHAFVSKDKPIMLMKIEAKASTV